MSKSPRQLIALATAACLGTAALTSAVQAQQVYPTVDPKVAPLSDNFYTPPSDGTLAAAAPGTVLRYRAVPTASLWSDVSQAWQLMYRSADGKDNPVAMVTTLLIPKNAPATGRKLISYQSFYDSLTLNCSPSSATTSGRVFEKLFFNSALSKGYVVAMADYEGLQSEWIAARNTGHGVLDGIRAVESFSKSGLSTSTPVGLIGYSGGGFATAWASEMAGSYAPELNIVGAAEGGLPVNPINVAKKVDGKLFAGAYFGAVVGLSRAYPEIDVNQYATAAGLKMIADIGTRCLGGTATGEPEMLTPYAGKQGATYLQDPNFLNLPLMQSINKENTMGQAVPKMPVFIFEGTADELMPLADATALAAYYCAGGGTVQYKQLSGADHVLGAAQLPSGMSYLMDRFDGKTAPTTCK